MKIKWTQTDRELSLAAQELLEELQFPGDTPFELSVSMHPGDRLALRRDGNHVEITYSRKNECFRALSYLAQIVADGRSIVEIPRYEMLGYMADVSRNAVLSKEGIVRLVHYLALMGYNTLMLYTEDTYEVPEYPHFGYMRGRYTSDELKEIDRLCERFGIELIPCIQTLAHLTPALRWPEFNGVKDTDDILMIGEERTYGFLDAAIRQCAQCFRSRKIHIGMDEAHMVGCGEYLKKHGFKNPSELMLEHLNRTVAICRNYGFSPMMWSDMFFRMQFDGEYRVLDGEIPEQIMRQVPPEVSLVYWDYSSVSAPLVSHMLECHRRFRNPIVFAGGAWKWYGFGAHNGYSLSSAAVLLDECEAKGIRQVLITAWGDNGGEASQFAGMASALYYAERCYGNRDETLLDRRSRLCFQCSFEELLFFDLPDLLPELGAQKIKFPKNPSKYLFYNDLLEGLFDLHLNAETAPACFAEHARQLFSQKAHPKFGYAFETLGQLCQILSYKCDMGLRIRNAYRLQKREELLEIAQKEIPQLLGDTERFLHCLRRQWNRENKPYGFISQEIRIGGMMARIGSVQARIMEYLNGSVDSIPELEETLIPVNVPTNSDLKFPYIYFNNWGKNVSVGIL